MRIPGSTGESRDSHSQVTIATFDLGGAHPPVSGSSLVVCFIYRDTDYDIAFGRFDIPGWAVSSKEPPPVEQQVFDSPSTSSLVDSGMSTIQPGVGYPTRDEVVKNPFYAALISIVAHFAQPRGFIHEIIQPALLPMLYLPI